MGYNNCEKKSEAQLARHIRAVAKNTQSVIFTDHANVQMSKLSKTQGQLT